MAAAADPSMLLGPRAGYTSGGTAQAGAATCLGVLAPLPEAAVLVAAAQEQFFQEVRKAALVPVRVRMRHVARSRQARGQAHALARRGGTATGLAIDGSTSARPVRVANPRVPFAKQRRRSGPAAALGQISCVVDP